MSARGTEERTLAERLAHVPQIGELVWIGVRPAHEAPMIALGEAELVAASGVRGDRAFRASRAGKRQVTLVQHEHLAVVAALVGRDRVEPSQLRRNLVVRGINLVALMRTRFRIGAALLEGTGPCEPCRKLDHALGDGAFAAMRGHGGITARILESAVVRLGDHVGAASA